MKFRKIQRRYKFNDRETPSHKHKYCVEAVAEIHTGSGCVFRHHILKCDACDSFKCIELPGNMTGSFGIEEEADSSLPVVKLKTRHKYDYFQDLEKCSQEG